MNGDDEHLVEGTLLEAQMFEAFVAVIGDCL